MTKYYLPCETAYVALEVNIWQSNGLYDLGWEVIDIQKSLRDIWFGIYVQTG